MSSGPASYNNEEKTRFSYVLERQPMSRRGYSFNARTEKRKVFEPKVIEREDCHLQRLISSDQKEFCFFHSDRLMYRVRIGIKWI